MRENAGKPNGLEPDDASSKFKVFATSIFCWDFASSGPIFSAPSAPAAAATLIGFGIATPTAATASPAVIINPEVTMDCKYGCERAWRPASGERPRKVTNKISYAA